MKILPLSLSVLLLAGCGDPGVVGPPREANTPGNAPRAATIAAPGGWGPVRVDMRRARAVEAMGGAENAAAPEREEWESCYYLQPAGIPGIFVMFENGRVSRIDINNEAENTITDTGLRVGATADEVRAAYGPRLEEEPHAYIGLPAEYLTWWDQRSGYGIRYVTNADGVVETILVGGDAIRYIEGCL